MLTILAGFISSCQQDDIGTRNVGNWSDTTAIIKSSSTISFGFALDANLLQNNPAYKAVAAREANNATLISSLNHGQIVQNNGSLVFTNADAAVAAVPSGLDLYGFNLIWYQNQNATYLKGRTGIVIPVMPNLVENPGFETPGSGKTFANWTVLNSTNATFSVGTGTANVHAGANSCQADVTAAGGANYTVQILSDAVPVIPGASYTISYWIRGSAAGSIQFELRNNDGASTVNYQGGKAVTTTWTQISYNYAPLNTTLAIAFDLGGNVNTFYIDDVSITAPTPPPPSPAVIAAKLDTVMNSYITGTVNHFKSSIHSWAVVNEPLASDGSIRNNSNSTVGSNLFVWSNYMGKNFALKAFRYAHAADPSALLFIDETQLDMYKVKTDSLAKLVSYLKDSSQIDGIGVQFQVDQNSSTTPSTLANIDYAFQKLAATGKKIKISGLSVNANPVQKAAASFSATDPLILNNQAVTYQYIINSYIMNVPAAQRAGITISGVDDANSNVYLYPALTTRSTAPFLFNDHLAKKPSYSAVLQTIKGR